MREIERGGKNKDSAGFKLQNKTCSAHNKDDVIHGFVSQSEDEVKALRWWEAGILAEEDCNLSDPN